MNKKLRLGFALSLSLLIALTGLAAASVFDLFGFFAGKQTYLPDMLADIAPLSIPTDNPAVTVDTPSISATAFISNAYYDGDFLVLAHSLSGSYGFALVEPTQSQLAQAEKTSYARYSRYAQDDALLQEAIDSAYAQWDSLSQTVTAESRAAMDAFTEAVGQSRPACLAYSTVRVDPRISFNGSGLYYYGVGSSSASRQDDNTWYTVETYPYPLPAIAQGQDSLDITLSLNVQTCYLYFDGTDFYNLPATTQQDAARMHATAARTSASKRTFSGTGTFSGAHIEAEAFLNDALGAVTLRADAPVFSMRIGENMLLNKWNLLVLDQNGSELEPASLFPVTLNPYADNDKILTYTVSCATSAPDTLYIYPYWGDEDPLQSDPIVLTLVP